MLLQQLRTDPDFVEFFYRESFGSMDSSSDKYTGLYRLMADNLIIIDQKDIQNLTNECPPQQGFGTIPGPNITKDYAEKKIKVFSVPLARTVGVGTIQKFEPIKKALRAEWNNAGSISVKDVRTIISSVRSSRCGTFYEADGQDFYVSPHPDLNLAHDVTEGNITKGENLYEKLRPEFSLHFPETVNLLKNDAKLEGNIFILIDVRDPQNIYVKIACGSAQQRSLRRHAILFELN